MKNPQQALWQLSAGEALTLPIGPGARLLSVSEGRLWLTLPGSARAPAKDVWLQAGESVHLASGSRVVLEAWPQAAFQLLVPPTACKDFSGRPAAKPLPTLQARPGQMPAMA